MLLNFLYDFFYFSANIINMCTYQIYLDLFIWSIDMLVMSYLAL